MDLHWMLHLPVISRFVLGPPIINMQVEPAGEYKLKWTDPDEPGLIKFLVEEKGCVRACMHASVRVSNICAALFCAAAKCCREKAFLWFSSSV